jgi:hypothetical protein
MQKHLDPNKPEQSNRALPRRRHRQDLYQRSLAGVSPSHSPNLALDPALALDL